jgi:hypothetical protein
MVDPWYRVPDPGETIKIAWDWVAVVLFELG